MIHSHDILRNRLYKQFGLFQTPQYDIVLLYESEWSEEFESLMRNRLVLGAFRYGLLGGSKPQWDRITYIEQKLNRYKETGNTEALVDVANLCLLEFVEGKHPNKHFSSMDDTDEHAKEKV